MGGRLPGTSFRRGGHTRSRQRERRWLMGCAGVRALLKAGGFTTNPTLKALRAGAERSALINSLRVGAAPFEVVAQLSGYWGRGHKAGIGPNEVRWSDQPPDFDSLGLEIRDVALLALPGPGLMLKDLRGLVPENVLRKTPTGNLVYPSSSRSSKCTASWTSS